MLSSHLRGSSWIRQFIFGFPLIGTLSQRFAFPLGPKQQVYPDLLQRGLFSSARARFDERTAKAGSKNGKALWPEAKEQRLKGWRSDPFGLTFSPSSTCAVGDRQLNIAFRFGVEHGEKPRACDNLKPSLTDLAFAVLTPIKLLSWGHVDDLCRKARSPNFDWEFFKSDQEDSYKQLPLKGTAHSLRPSRPNAIPKKMVRLFQSYHGLRGRRCCTTL